MYSLFRWLAQRSGLVIGLSLILFAAILFAATLILRFGFDLWWPTGIALATVFGVIGLFAGGMK